MVEFTEDGGIKVKPDRVVYLDSKLTLLDYIKLNCDPNFNCGVSAGFPARASSGVGGFTGGGGAGGSGTNRGGPGPTGTSGIQGPQAPDGSDQGNQGNQGPEGAQGPRGIQGRQGPQGPQGVQGPQGWEGFQGAQGNQGSQGFFGLQGFQGVGEEGLQGFQGAQGSQGNQGAQGVQGAQGWQGFQGAGTQGAQGSQAITPSEFSNLNPARKIFFAHASIAGVAPGIAGVADNIVSVTGIQTLELDGIDQYVNYSSGNSGWYANYNCYYATTEPILKIKMKTGPNANDITDQLLWEGFMSWNGGGLYVGATGDSDTPPEHIAAFRCGKAGIDTTWKAVTNDASVAAHTITDTGVLIVIDTKYEFIIDCSDPAAIDFYINDVLVATHTTSLPFLPMGVLSRGWKTNPDTARNQAISLWYMTRY